MRQGGGFSPAPSFGRDGGSAGSQQLQCPVLHWGEAGRGLWRRPSQIPSYSSFTHFLPQLSLAEGVLSFPECIFPAAVNDRLSPALQRGSGGTHHVHPGPAPAPPQRVSQPPANKFHPLPRQNAHFVMVIKIFTHHTTFTVPLMTSAPKNPHTTREAALSQPHQGRQYPPSIQFHHLPHHKNPQSQAIASLSFAFYFTGHCFNFKFP